MSYVGSVVSRLRDAEASLTYPANQHFDPATLEPANDVTEQRLRALSRGAPELFDTGGSLLDLGSSKGFVSFLLRDRYSRIDGYEISPQASQFAADVVQLHDLEHIRFHNTGFRNVDITADDAVYDVVYCGSVHHHLIKDALIHGAPMWLPLQKLKALAGRYLVIDGPLSFAGDYSLETWEKTYKWPPTVRKAYTQEAHVRALRPQFELVRGPVPDERGRHIMVFRRVAPNMPRITLTAEDRARVIACGTAKQANSARPENSVVKLGGLRYKFDPCGDKPDALWMILNSLPDWFAHTKVILQDAAGGRAGDVAAWVYGTPEKCIQKLIRHWLTMNDMLACIGLVEIHLKIGDYVRRVDGRLIDVDVDMIGQVGNVASAADYLSRWRVGATRALGAPLTDRIIANLSTEWVFRDALAELGGGGDEAA